MNSRKALAVGALWMALTVALGAFGAHGLEERLTASGHVATWETGVRYQAWSALGLVALGLLTARPDLAGAGRVTGWLLLVGSLLQLVASPIPQTAPIRCARSWAIGGYGIQLFQRWLG